MASVEKAAAILLGVGPGANQKEVKAAFNRLALQYHPDKCTDADAPEKFRKARQAYETLKECRASGVVASVARGSASACSTPARETPSRACPTSAREAPSKARNNCRKCGSQNAVWTGGDIWLCLACFRAGKQTGEVRGFKRQEKASGSKQKRGNKRKRKESARMIKAEMGENKGKTKCQGRDGEKGKGKVKSNCQERKNDLTDWECRIRDILEGELNKTGRDWQSMDEKQMLRLLESTPHGVSRMVKMPTQMQLSVIKKWVLARKYWSDVLAADESSEEAADDCMVPDVTSNSTSSSGSSSTSSSSTSSMKLDEGTWNDGATQEVESGGSTLPPGWQKLESRSRPGVYYYYNSLTGVSQAEAP